MDPNNQIPVNPKQQQRVSPIRLINSKGSGYKVEKVRNRRNSTPGAISYDPRPSTSSSATVQNNIGPDTPPHDPEHSKFRIQIPKPLQKVLASKELFLDYFYQTLKCLTQNGDPFMGILGILNFTNSGLWCPFCSSDELFNPKMLNIHIFVVHDKRMRFACTFEHCRMHCETPLKMLDHYRTFHTKAYPPALSQCVSNPHASCHNLERHGNNREYVLILHQMMDHEIGEFICETCGTRGGEFTCTYMHQALEHWGQEHFRPTKDSSVGASTTQDGAAPEVLERDNLLTPPSSVSSTGDCLSPPVRRTKSKSLSSNLSFLSSIRSPEYEFLDPPVPSSSSAQLKNFPKLLSNSNLRSSSLKRKRSLECSSSTLGHSTISGSSRDNSSGTHLGTNDALDIQHNSSYLSSKVRKSLGFPLSNTSSALLKRQNSGDSNSSCPSPLDLTIANSSSSSLPKTSSPSALHTSTSNSSGPLFRRTSSDQLSTRTSGPSVSNSSDTSLSSTSTRSGPSSSSQSKSSDYQSLNSSCHQSPTSLDSAISNFSVSSLPKTSSPSALHTSTSNFSGPFISNSFNSSLSNTSSPLAPRGSSKSNTLDRLGPNSTSLDSLISNSSSSSSSSLPNTSSPSALHTTASNSSGFVVSNTLDFPESSSLSSTLLNTLSRSASSTTSANQQASDHLDLSILDRLISGTSSFSSSKTRRKPLYHYLDSKLPSNTSSPSAPNTTSIDLVSNSPDQLGHIDSNTSSNSKPRTSKAILKSKKLNFDFDFDFDFDGLIKPCSSNILIPDSKSAIIAIKRAQYLCPEGVLNPACECAKKKTIFKDTATLLEHVISLHPHWELFKCPVPHCPNRFDVGLGQIKLYDQIVKHFNQSHGGWKAKDSYVCRELDFFTNEICAVNVELGEMANHFKYHLPGPNVCGVELVKGSGELCSRCFTTFDQVVLHKHFEHEMSINELFNQLDLRKKFALWAYWASKNRQESDTEGCDSRETESIDPDVVKCSFGESEPTEPKLERSELNGFKQNRSKPNGTILNRSVPKGSKSEEYRTKEPSGTKLDGSELNRSKINGSKSNRSIVKELKLNGPKPNQCKPNGSITNEPKPKRTKPIESKLKGSKLNGPKLVRSNVNRSTPNRSEPSGPKPNRSNPNEFLANGSITNGLEPSPIEPIGTILNSEPNGPNPNRSNLNETILNGFITNGPEPSLCEPIESIHNETEPNGPMSNRSNPNEFIANGSITNTPEPSPIEPIGSILNSEPSEPNPDQSIPNDSTPKEPTPTVSKFKPRPPNSVSLYDRSAVDNIPVVPALRTQLEPTFISVKEVEPKFPNLKIMDHVEMSSNSDPNPLDQSKNPSTEDPSKDPQPTDSSPKPSPEPVSIEFAPPKLILPEVRVPEMEPDSQNCESPTNASWGSSSCSDSAYNSDHNPQTHQQVPSSDSSSIGSPNSVSEMIHLDLVVQVPHPIGPNQETIEGLPSTDPSPELVTCEPDLNLESMDDLKVSQIHKTTHATLGEPSSCAQSRDYSSWPVLELLELALDFDEEQQIHQPSQQLNQSQSSVYQPTNQINQSQSSIHLPSNQINQSQSSIHLPSNQINQPQSSIHLPSNQINQPQSSIHLPSNQINQPQSSIHLPSNEINQSQSSIHLPSNQISQSQHSIHLPSLIQPQPPSTVHLPQPNRKRPPLIDVPVLLDYHPEPESPTRNSKTSRIVPSDKYDMDSVYFHKESDVVGPETAAVGSRVRQQVEVPNQNQRIASAQGQQNLEQQSPGHESRQPESRQQAQQNLYPYHPGQRLPQGYAPVNQPYPGYSVNQLRIQETNQIGSNPVGPYDPGPQRIPMDQMTDHRRIEGTSFFQCLDPHCQVPKRPMQISSGRVIYVHASTGYFSSGQVSFGQFSSGQIVRTGQASQNPLEAMRNVPCCQLYYPPPPCHESQTSGQVTGHRISGQQQSQMNESMTSGQHASDNPHVQPSSGQVAESQAPGQLSGPTPGHQHISANGQPGTGQLPGPQASGKRISGKTTSGQPNSVQPLGPQAPGGSSGHLISGQQSGQSSHVPGDHRLPTCQPPIQPPSQLQRQLQGQPSSQPPSQLQGQPQSQPPSQLQRPHSVQLPGHRTSHQGPGQLGSGQVVGPQAPGPRISGQADSNPVRVYASQTPNGSSNNLISGQPNLGHVPGIRPSSLPPGQISGQHILNQFSGQFSGSGHVPNSFGQRIPSQMNPGQMHAPQNPAESSNVPRTQSPRLVPGQLPGRHISSRFSGQVPNFHVNQRIPPQMYPGQMLGPQNPGQPPVQSSSGHCFSGQPPSGRVSSIPGQPSGQSSCQPTGQLPAQPLGEPPGQPSDQSTVSGQLPSGHVRESPTPAPPLTRMLLCFSCGKPKNTKECCLYTTGQARSQSKNQPAKNPVNPVRVPTPIPPANASSQQQLRPLPPPTPNHQNQQSNSRIQVPKNPNPITKQVQKAFIARVRELQSEQISINQRSMDDESQTVPGSSQPQSSEASQKPILSPKHQAQLGIINSQLLGNPSRISESQCQLGPNVPVGTQAHAKSFSGIFNGTLGTETQDKIGYQVPDGCYFLPFGYPFPARPQAPFSSTNSYYGTYGFNGYQVPIGSLRATRPQEPMGPPFLPRTNSFPGSFVTPESQSQIPVQRPATTRPQSSESLGFQNPVRSNSFSESYGMPRFQSQVPVQSQAPIASQNVTSSQEPIGSLVPIKINNNPFFESNGMPRSQSQDLVGTQEPIESQLPVRSNSLSRSQFKVPVGSQLPTESQHATKLPESIDQLNQRRTNPGSDGNLGTQSQTKSVPIGTQKPIGSVVPVRSSFESNEISRNQTQVSIQLAARPQNPVGAQLTRSQDPFRRQLSTSVPEIVPKSYHPLLCEYNFQIHSRLIHSLGRQLTEWDLKQVTNWIMEQHQFAMKRWEYVLPNVEDALRVLIPVILTNSREKSEIQRANPHLASCLRASDPVPLEHSEKPEMTPELVKQKLPFLINEKAPVVQPSKPSEAVSSEVQYKNPMPIDAQMPNSMGNLSMSNYQMFREEMRRKNMYHEQMRNLSTPSNEAMPNNPVPNQMQMPSEAPSNNPMLSAIMRSKNMLGDQMRNLSTPNQLQMPSEAPSNNNPMLSEQMRNQSMPNYAMLREEMRRENMFNGQMRNQPNQQMPREASSNNQMVGEQMRNPSMPSQQMLINEAWLNEARLGEARLIQTIRNRNMPGGTMPSGAVPNNPMLSAIMRSQNMPNQMQMPSEASSNNNAQMLSEQMRSQNMLNEPMHSLTIQNPTIQNQAIPNHLIPNRSITNQTTQLNLTTIPIAVMLSNEMPTIFNLQQQIPIPRSSVIVPNFSSMPPPATIPRLRSTESQGPQKELSTNNVTSSTSNSLNEPSTKSGDTIGDIIGGRSAAYTITSTNNVPDSTGPFIRDVYTINRSLQSLQQVCPTTTSGPSTNSIQATPESTGNRLSSPEKDEDYDSEPGELMIVEEPELDDDPESEQEPEPANQKETEKSEEPQSVNFKVQGIIDHVINNNSMILISTYQANPPLEVQESQEEYSAQIHHQPVGPNPNSLVLGPKPKRAYKKRAQKVSCPQTT